MTDAMPFPNDMEQVGWIDELGQLWGIHMRSGDVPTDRRVWALHSRDCINRFDAEAWADQIEAIVDPNPEPTEG